MTGHVKTSGAPVAGAYVEVRGTEHVHATSDAQGAFAVRVSPGVYWIETTARGFAQAFAGPLNVASDERIDVSLESLAGPQLRVISSIRVNGQLALQREVIPSVDVSRAQMNDVAATRAVDVLASIPSVTFARPDGGADNAPSLVALRGPDPSETLIALDGQILNDANTGDLDLSRFPVAAFSAVDVTEGLGPSDNEGSNTIGGAVNVISLQPTVKPQEAFSFSRGSYGTGEGWYNTTGTKGRFGYAFALDDLQEHGYVDQDVSWQHAGTTSPLHLGSAISSRALLAKARWEFSQQADMTLRVFSLGNNRDESGILNTPVSAALQGPGADFTGPGAATFAQDVRAYDLTGRAPLGAGSLVYGGSLSDNAVDFTGGGVSPYDVTHHDRRDTVSLSWQRDNEDSEFAFGGYVRAETFTAAGINGTLAQQIQSYFVRGGMHPSKRLHLQGGLYLSHYSTFGSNLDGRVGLNYDVDSRSVLRASVGTGFRAPLLVERYLFPIADLTEDANCVYVGQGNPGEQPEHATEYELGYGRRINSSATMDVSLYRTNLRDPIETFYPLNASCAQPGPFFSFPTNVGNAVYEGAETRYSLELTRTLLLQASYGLNVAYPANMPASVANPTSGGSLVAGQQFLNIPQQQGSLTLSWRNGSWHAAILGYARGWNNELNQDPYAVLNVAAGYGLGAFDLTLAGTNLTNAVAGKFTLPGAGVPYRGLVAAGTLGPLPTDRFFLQPASIRLILTVKS